MKSYLPLLVGLIIACTIASPANSAQRHVVIAEHSTVVAHVPRAELGHRGCVGKTVRAGANLADVANAEPAGTTFCLAAARFVVSQTVTLQAGDRVEGQGPRRTLIRPSGTGAPLVGLEVSGSAGSRVRVAKLDIGGFSAAPGADCTSQCGAAMHSSMQTGGLLSLRRVRCHDNGTVCLSTPTGDISAAHLNCFANGFHAGSLLDPQYRSASCIKTFGGSLTLTHSNIHDNDWNGVWCDYCDHTTWSLENNVFDHNGHAAVQWEISGQLETDTAMIRDNTIKRNGWQVDVAGSFTSAGVVITGGRNITVEENVFRNNRHVTSPTDPTLACCLAVRIYDDDRAPWDPNLQDILLVDNDIGDGEIAGCDFSGVTCIGNR